MEPDVEADGNALAKKPSRSATNVHRGRMPIPGSGFPFE
jgi:hypothetical protein